MPNVSPLRPGDPRRVGRYRLTGRVDDFAGENMARQDVFLGQRVDGEAVMAAFPGTGRRDDAAARDRFIAEARAARNIPPFCVARILDAGVEGGQPYLVTEFVSGPSLAEVVHREGPLPVAELRALAIGCATGMASIHQAGLVHGQFGPDMVVVAPDGPRVMDFSITPPYGAATPAADILAWAQVVASPPPGTCPPPRRTWRRSPTTCARCWPSACAPTRGAPACPRRADRTAERRRPVRRAARRGDPSQPGGRPRPGSGLPGIRRRAAPRRPLPRGPMGRCVPGLHRGDRGRGVLHHRAASTVPVPRRRGRTPPPPARWPGRTCPSPGS